MVRKMRQADLDTVADIWLTANIEAHSFVPEVYWSGHFEMVKELLAQAELYVWEDAAGIQGFIGLEADYIAGLFIRSGARSCGIGKQLLDRAKAGKDRLTLRVYQKNVRAVRFYRREDFAVREESVDESTGEAEYGMLWER